MEILLREILGQLNTARAKVEMYEPETKEQACYKISVKSDINNAIEKLELHLLAF